MRLKKAMGKDGSDEEVKALMERNQREIEEMKKSYEEKLAAAAQQASLSATGKSADEIHQLREKHPHMYNLNADPQLTGTIVHILKPGKYKVSRRSLSTSTHTPCTHADR